MDVLDEALARGGEQARQDAGGVLVDTDAVFCRAEAACDEALRTYVALDERKFREVFTLAWSTGYCAQRRSSPRAGSGSTSGETKLHG